MKTIDPATASLIAAGEALRKAAEEAEANLFAMGWGDGNSAIVARRHLAEYQNEPAAQVIRNRVKRAIDTWNKAVKANRGAGARKGSRKK